MHTSHFWLTIGGMALFGLKVVAALWISVLVAVLGFFLPLQGLVCWLFDRNLWQAIRQECKDSLDQ